jgi:hypothetical protein
MQTCFSSVNLNVYPLKTSNPSIRALTLSNLARLCMFLFISVSIVSCQKGDAGPAGPAGPAGASGPTGATGAPGSANVVYSQWFTPATYVKDTIFGSYGFYYNKATTDITQKILDSGLVITYGKLDGYTAAIWPTNQVAPLPISIIYMDGASPNVDVWSALATPGNLRIQLVSSLNAYGGISNLHQFRYVIVPGGAKSAVASIKPGQEQGNTSTFTDAAAAGDVIKNYKQMTYEQVCLRLHIPE